MVLNNTVKSDFWAVLGSIKQFACAINGHSLNAPAISSSQLELFLIIIMQYTYIYINFYLSFSFVFYMERHQVKYALHQ